MAGLGVGGNHGSSAVAAVHRARPPKAKPDPAYRAGQDEHGDGYKGDFSEIDVAHALGVNEAEVFLEVPAEDIDHAANLRNQNRFTNRSVHVRMDNTFKKRFKEGTVGPLKGFSYETKNESGDKETTTVSVQEMVNWLTRKIEQCKRTGQSGRCPLDTPKTYAYLRKTAEDLRMDLTIFNGKKYGRISNGTQPPVELVAGLDMRRFRGNEQAKDLIEAAREQRDYGGGGGVPIAQSTGQPDRRFAPPRAAAAARPAVDPMVAAGGSWQMAPSIPRGGHVETYGSFANLPDPIAQHARRQEARR
jgi:hypothetical protein